jgi:hypothetical protein
VIAAGELAGVAVADVGGEEFDEALLCALAGGCDEGCRKRLWRRAGSLIAPCPPSSHTTPRRLEIDAAPPFGLDREHFASRLVGGFGFLWRLYDWLRSGDFVFQCINRLPQHGDRPLPANGKMLARFLSLRVPSSWSANWKRGTCSEGTGVECRGLIILRVCGRSVTERRRQAFVDGRFERENFGVAKSLSHFLGIESLKACDARLQTLDTPPLLSGGQNR